jgi:hypothetical protein
MANIYADYDITDKHHIKEFDDLHNFVMSLVIKNEDKANEEETINISKKAFEYIDAVLGTKQFISEAEKQYIIDNYIEENSYYRWLFDTYGIDFVTARTAKDFSILYYEEKWLEQREINVFLESYVRSSDYFFKVLYTPAFKSHRLNREFITLLVVFMTMKHYLSTKLSFALDVDFYNEYMVRNMLISFNVDFFSDLPLKYQKRLLKNVNNFIITKGTNKVIIDIVQMFGFENVQLMKYYLVKVFNKDSVTNETQWDSPDLKFVKTPIDSTTVEQDINSAKLLDYEGVISGDPYWHASKASIVNHAFNYINTKYIGLDIGISLVREVIELSYFVNMLRYIETLSRDDANYSNKTKLLFLYNTDYSTSPLKIIDLVISLQYLLIKAYGFVDNVVLDPYSVKKIYGYDFTNLLEFCIDDVGCNIKNFSEFSHQVTGNNITKENFIETFLYNREYRTALENLIINEKNYKLYRELKDLWKLKMTINYCDDYMEPYAKYSDYLLESNPEFYYKLIPPDTYNDEEKKDFYYTHINEICSMLDSYIDSPEMDFFLKNSIFTLEVIKKYLSRLIRTFKSYTIDLKSINIIFLFDSKLFNTVRLFEEHYWHIEIDHSILIPYTEVSYFDYYENLMDEFNYIDEWLEAVTTSYFEKINYAELAKKMSILKRPELVPLIEEKIQLIKSMNLRSDEILRDFCSGMLTLILDDDLVDEQTIHDILEISVTKLYSGAIRNIPLIEMKPEQINSTLKKLRGTIALQDSFTIEVNED